MLAMLLGTRSRSAHSGLDSDRLKRLDPPEDQRAFGPVAVQLSPNSRLRLRAENSGNPILSAPRVMIDFTLSF